MEHDAVERRTAACGVSRVCATAPSPVTTISRRAQPQIDGVEQRHMHVKVFGGERRDGGDQAIGLIAPGIVAGEYRETNEVLCGDRVVIGRRFVARSRPGG